MITVYSYLVQLPHLNAKMFFWKFTHVTCCFLSHECTPNMNVNRYCRLHIFVLFTDEC